MIQSREALRFSPKKPDDGKEETPNWNEMHVQTHVLTNVAGCRVDELLADKLAEQATSM